LVFFIAAAAAAWFKVRSRQVGREGEVGVGQAVRTVARTAFESADAVVLLAELLPLQILVDVAPGLEHCFDVCAVVFVFDSVL